MKAGGPTVKNVSGFDLCRLLVGSCGTLGFLGEVMLRTRPLAAHSQWFSAETADPAQVFAALYRPVSVLWNGGRVWALLEGHPADVAAQATTAGLAATDGPPVLPAGGRLSVAPAALLQMSVAVDGPFVAELGVGVVHTERRADPVDPEERALALSRAITQRFDPTGRMNPGRAR